MADSTLDSQAFLTKAESWVNTFLERILITRIIFLNQLINRRRLLCLNVPTKIEIVKAPCAGCTLLSSTSACACGCTWVHMSVLSAALHDVTQDQESLLLTHLCCLLVRVGQTENVDWFCETCIDCCVQTSLCHCLSWCLLIPGVSLSAIVCTILAGVLFVFVCWPHQSTVDTCKGGCPLLFSVLTKRMARHIPARQGVFVESCREIAIFHRCSETLLHCPISPWL